MESSRARRRVTNVNYAEVSFDESSFNERATTAQSKNETSTVPSHDIKLVVKSEVQKSPPQKAQDGDMNQIPMNWQRKFSDAEKLSGILDVSSATIKSTNPRLQLEDGTVYSPEGEYY